MKKIFTLLFKNISLKQTIAKNTFWIFSGQIGGRIIRAIIVIYAARVIGAGEYGFFSYIVSLAAIFTIVGDPGINAAFLTRTSQKQENFAPYFSGAIVLKLALLAVSSLLTIFIAPLISKFPGTAAILPFAVIILVSDALREFTISAVRSVQKMELEALINGVTNVAIVILGWLFIKIQPSALYLTAGYSAGSAIGLFAGIYSFRAYFKKIFSDFSAKIAKDLLKTGLPLAFAGVLGTLMVNTDALLLGIWRTTEEIGYYGAALRPISILYAGLGILPVAVFPIAAKLTMEKEKFASALKKTMQYSVMLIFPLTVGGLIAAEKLIILLFGTEYIPATPTFQILSLTLFANFAIIALGYALMSYDRQKTLFWSSALGFVSNALFDVFLIPKYGGPGSALATLINQMFIFLFLWVKTRSILNTSFAPDIKKIAPASLVMGALVWMILGAGLNVLAAVAIGVLIYFAMLYALREPLLEETLSALKRALGNKTTPSDAVV